jgi:hypothetical protein
MNAQAPFHTGPKDDPLNDTLEKSTDEKKHTFDKSKKYDWERFKGH